MSMTIDLDDLIDAVRKQAATRPDYAYEKQNDAGGPTCRYIEKDGSPGCIIGHAFLDIGVPLDVVQTFDNSVKWIGGTVVMHILLEAFGVRRSDSRVEWLTQVQTMQDLRLSWSSAVASADRTVVL